jgi:hypothetical protein
MNLRYSKALAKKSSKALAKKSSKAIAKSLLQAGIFSALVMAGCGNTEKCNYIIPQSKDDAVIDYKKITKFRIGYNSSSDLATNNYNKRNLYWAISWASDSNNSVFRLTQKNDSYLISSKFSNDSRPEFIVVPKISVNEGMATIDAKIFADDEFLKSEKEITAEYGYEDPKTNFYNQAKDNPGTMWLAGLSQEDIKKIESGEGISLKKKRLSFSKPSISYSDLRALWKQGWSDAAAFEQMIPKKGKAPYNIANMSKLSWSYKINNNIPVLILRTKRDTITLRVKSYANSIDEMYNQLKE